MANPDVPKAEMLDILADAEPDLPEWKEGDWAYAWAANGMMKAVKNPHGEIITFEYDALGRRKAKIVKDTVYRYVWDGNLLLHEWNYPLSDRPNLVVNEDGLLGYDKTEPLGSDLITWVYDQNKFNPSAKIVNGLCYSIISDYLGTPVQAFDDTGKKVWDCELDIYGKISKLSGSREFVPFRYQGQYEDTETGLYYNRFRYYDPEIGGYVSKDPIGLEGGDKLYSYVEDSNYWLDVFGLMPWGDFMNGATAKITAGGNSGIYSSSPSGHAEINGLKDFSRKGWLNGQDVHITDVTGDFNPGGSKPVGVCTKCRSNIFSELQRGGAKSVTIPITKGNVTSGTVTIHSKDFAKMQAEIDAIRNSPGTNRTKSDAAWKALQNCK